MAYKFSKLNPINAVKSKGGYRFKTLRSPTEGLKYKLMNNVTYYSFGMGMAIDTDIIIASKIDGIPVTTIAESAFENCTNLTSVIIPDSVTYIGNFAFKNCTNLKNITIPDSAGIGAFAFSKCPHLITEYNNCQYFGAIDNPYRVLIRPVDINQSTYEIAESTQMLASCAFNNCPNLKSITIPDSVTRICSSAFGNCRNLISITIPDSVTSIEDETFHSCYSLKSITIPDSVTSISESVFERCYNLVRIEIPDSVTSIGTWAFNGCKNLVDVYYKGTAEQWAAITIGVRNTELTNATIHYNYTG